MLVPVGRTVPVLSHDEILKGMRKLRKRVKPAQMSVREMVRKGAVFNKWFSLMPRCPRLVLS
jgi:hypothetical protein